MHTLSVRRAKPFNGASAIWFTVLKLHSLDSSEQRSSQGRVQPRVPTRAASAACAPRAEDGDSSGTAGMISCIIISIIGIITIIIITIIIIIIIINNKH